VIVAKILMVGDTVTANTGFANVIRPLALASVKAGHEVKQIGWFYKGEKHDYPFDILPASNSQMDYYGSMVTEIVLNAWEPDITFVLGDPWMVEWLPLLPSRKKTKVVHYFPVDGYPFPKGWAKLVEDVDHPVVYSKFAYDEVKKVCPKKNLKLIYHGIDISQFYPESQKKIDKFKKESGLPLNKWMCGVVARNQWRKNLPAIFKAFGEFCVDKNDVLLYVHSVVQDMGWNLDRLIEQNNLIGKVALIRELKPDRGVSEEAMRLIYNMCDVITVPTLGEGFMLPLAEAHACGKPVLVTDCSCIPEMTVSEHELIKPCAEYAPANPDKGYAIFYKIPDHDDYLQKLNWFYHNQGEAKGIGKMGRDYVVDRYSIDKMVNQFLDLFTSIKEGSV